MYSIGKGVGSIPSPLIYMQSFHQQARFDQQSARFDHLSPSSDLEIPLSNLQLDLGQFLMVSRRPKEVFLKFVQEEKETGVSLSSCAVYFAPDSCKWKG